jgi:hypothetical protein
MSMESDGSVRELDKEEQNYVLEEFHPNDGARPYEVFNLLITINLSGHLFGSTDCQLNEDVDSEITHSSQCGLRR